MAQQALDSLVVESEVPGAIPREPEPPLSLPGWRSIPHAIIRAGGEEGYVDLAALDAGRGVALICLLDEGEEASPEEARAAFRTMLRDEGQEKSFPGELPVVALAVPRAEAAELGATIERVFAGMPRPALPSGWVDWLAERLASDRPAPVAAPPPLAAPSRDEMLPDKPVTGRALPAPLREETPSRNPKIDLALDASLREEALREKPGIDLTLDAPLREEALPEKPRDDLVLDAPPRDDVAPERTEAGILDLELEAPAETAPSGGSLLDWGTSLGFAFGVVLALIVCLALVSYNGRLF